MATQIFRAKITEEGLLPVPKETLRLLGLGMGDEVEVSLVAAQEAKECEQQELQVSIAK